jgi:hypothetical protein
MSFKSKRASIPDPRGECAEQLEYNMRSPEALVTVGKLSHGDRTDE